MRRKSNTWISTTISLLRIRLKNSKNLDLILIDEQYIESIREHCKFACRANPDSFWINHISLSTVQPVLHNLLWFCLRSIIVILKIVQFAFFQTIVCNHLCLLVFLSRLILTHSSHSISLSALIYEVQMPTSWWSICSFELLSSYNTLNLYITFIKGLIYFWDLF